VVPPGRASGCAHRNGKKSDENDKGVRRPDLSRGTPGDAEGVVEAVGSRRRLAFINSRELWRLLTVADRRRKPPA